MVIMQEGDYLAHYGIKRKSGRYPWGSGGEENHETRSKDFLDYVSDLRRQGLTEVQIAEGIGITTTQLRAAKSIAKAEHKQSQIANAQRLRDEGYSNIAIGTRMGLNESSVRALLAPGEKDKADILQSTAQMLRDTVAEKKYVDIGAGTENYVGVSNTRFKTAIAILEQEGYKTHYLKVPQLGTTHETSLKILAAPGVTYSEVLRNRDQIQQIRSHSDDEGKTWTSANKPPLPIHPKRVAIRYAEDGGDKADGVIYVRPGVEDISLGNARYAQVRVQVGDKKYLKGMAVYKDDLPSGVDLMFNTNKSDTGNKLDAMKDLSDDPDLPFGAIVRQIVDRPGHPDAKVTSAMNIVNEEGKWAEWSRNLPSQMLSKQSPTLARTQLDMTYDRRKTEFEALAKLTNPAVRKKMLETFADSTDSASVHLKAAALPRQASRVIMPIDSIPPSQVYAPHFRDGERVSLIRFPHGGTFEIPDLIVNNNHPEAKKLLGDAQDAIGIHHTVAERLSGADFDGDTVLVIPNGTGKVKSTPALEGLKNFNPKTAYPAYEGMPKMTPRMKQTQMGVVSNLITDMTIKGASHAEIVRAVRHSMVVIDAEKHNLNYKESAIRNGIPQLKEKYQGSKTGGASTLISRANADIRVPTRKDRPAAQGGPVDKATGKRVFVETGDVSFRTGKPRLVKSKRLAETDDARTLLSEDGVGTPMERVYAEHSNKLKSLANDARRVAVNTKSTNYSPSAKKVYASEVASLNSKLGIALKNAPLERQAQIIGNATVAAKRAAFPNMDDSTLKKTKAQAINDARNRTGARKHKIEITKSEWDAIQAGAISNSKLTDILTHADLEIVRELATPKRSVLMSSTETRRAQQMAASGYTTAEIADQLGVSTSTLERALAS